MFTSQMNYAGPAALLLLLAFISSSATDTPPTVPPSKAPMKGKEIGIRCQINDQEVLFDNHACAITNTAGEMLLKGYRGKSTLLIQMPKVQVGIQRLKDTPRLRLDYSRDLYSSDSRDHFAANSGTPQSQLEVKVERVDSRNRLIEGQFSAVALSTPEGQVQITKGRFYLPLIDEAARR